MPSKKKYFLDTVFLASFCIKNHKDEKAAKKLFATLLAEDAILYTSPLCIYELWDVIRRYENDDHSKQRIRRKVNKLLKKIGLKFFNLSNFSFSDIFNSLNNYTEIITSAKSPINILPIDNRHINPALEAIKNFNSKPGDAFHISNINIESLDCVVTGNKKDFAQTCEVRWY